MEWSWFIIHGIYVVLVSVALWNLSAAIWQYGRSSIGIFLGYVGISTVLLAAIRVFIALADRHVMPIDDSTTMVGWHLMFYMATATLLFSARTIGKFANVSAKKPSAVPVILWGIVVFCVSVYIFSQSQSWDATIVSGFSGSIWDHSGLMHFIAFAFAGGVARYLAVLQHRFRTSIGVIAMPLLVVIGVLSGIHLWELLTESWHVIAVSSVVGEGFEQLLWIPVYAGIANAFWRLRLSL